MGRLMTVSVKLLMLLAIVGVSQAFNWQSGNGGQVQWSLDCDFNGSDIGKQQASSADCGGLCIANTQCTHFTAVNGVCYLKHFSVSATASSLTGGVCGWVNRGSSSSGSTAPAPSAPSTPTGSATTYQFGSNAALVLDQSYGTQNLQSKGVTTSGGAVTLAYDTSGGARIYMTTSNKQQYLNLKMLNREFTFTVDTSKIGCGYNGALYFVDMSSAVSQAPSGSGYCDGGGYFPPCSELDLWEGNTASTVFTVHSPHDNGGCGYFVNSAGNVYGPNNQINSNLPIEIVTRFRTNNGQDSGTLSSIERIYRQNGKKVGPTQTLNDSYCSGKGARGTTMSQMGDGMKNGMTLAISLWGGPRSPGSNDWLDTGANGPCQPGQSSPASGGSVTFSNIKFGPIGST